MPDNQKEGLFSRLRTLLSRNQPTKTPREKISAVFPLYRLSYDVVKGCWVVSTPLHDRERVDTADRDLVLGTGSSATEAIDDAVEYLDYYARMYPLSRAIVK